MSLTFNHETHEYRWNGIVRPSVTQILKRVYADEYAGVPEAVLARKAALGTAVHRAVELALIGALDGYELHPDTEGYVRSFQRWLTFVDIEVEALEEQFYCGLGYCGTIDCLAKVGVGGLAPELMLIDWKTTAAPMPSHRLQTAGYALGHARGVGRTRACLYLDNEGGVAKLVRHENAEDLNDWAATLRVYNIKERQ